MVRRFDVVPLLLAAALALAPGCRTRPPGPPTLDELRNATYRGFAEPTGPVTLRNGR